MNMLKIAAMAPRAETTALPTVTGPTLGDIGGDMKVHTGGDIASQ